MKIWLLFLTLVVLCASSAELKGNDRIDVVINEIHYDPDIRTELVEFIELHNTGSTHVDLTGWYFNDGIAYQFPAGSILPAGGYIIVTQNPEHVQEKWGSGRLGNFVYGPFEGKLANDGEKIELCNADGEQVDQVDYQLGFPWPTVGYAVPNNQPGTGHSIQLINPMIDNDLGGSWRSASPTPAAYNDLVYLENSPPHIRQVEHSPQQPKSGEAVTITAKVTDADGITNMMLYYQVVEPGSYIPVTVPNYPSTNPATLPNSAYETGWANSFMNDSGLSGDAVAGDDIYSVQLPASLQRHRRLVRYRIFIVDGESNSLQVPYEDDPQPNFAYFVYDGVPSWGGAINPNGSWPDNQVVTYSAELMRSLPVYHLLSREIDIQNCQYNRSYDNTAYYFSGTLVYDGEVYDNVHYRVRGQYSTFQTGKEKWKFDFNRGHYFQARDDYGKQYKSKWDKMNIGTGTCPWWQYPHPGSWDRGTRGMVMNEALAFRLYNMAGVPSCNTNYFHLRIIDDSVEANSANQYEGDFWGLYFTIEHSDGTFLDEHGLPDGNIYRMDGGPNKTHQGQTQVTNDSDVSSFINMYNSSPNRDWWAQNVNLTNYYSSKAVGVAINDSDRRPQSNCVFYHNSETGQWWMLPWDLDLTFEWATHYTDWEHFRYALSYSEYNIASKNRARELLDLLLNDDQAWQVIDEIASIISTPYDGKTFVEANRAMWDYHPRTARKGQFYEYNEFLETKDWPGLIEYYKKFFTPTGLSDVTSGSYGVHALTAEAADNAIPRTPTITYSGSVGFPADALTFEVDSFSDPQGSGTFSAMTWRLAEVEQGSEFLPPITPHVDAVTIIGAESPEWKYFKGDAGEPSSPADAWRQMGFDDSAWLIGRTSIGYGDNDDNTIVSDMQSTYSSVYLRHQFSLSDVDQIDSLRLNVYLDDGCVIWINGTEVARIRVSSGFKSYDDLTGEAYVDNAIWETYSLSGPYDYLVEGENVIAIHVMNSSLNSSDLSIDVTLIAETGPEDVPESPAETGLIQGTRGKYEIDAVWESEEITPYSRTMTLPVGVAKPSQTYRVRCRMKDTTDRWSHWSNPIQFVAGQSSSDAHASDLRITELMYNPANADTANGELAVDNENFEFVELKNIGSETIELTQVRFTNGIDFTFPTIELGAGEYVVVIQDRNAFETRYGSALNIAGTYTGRLDNGGERISLENAAGQTILDFRYDDAWYDVTDGQGFSLTIIDPTHPDPNSWNMEGSWRTSIEIGGSPGWDDMGDF